MVAGVGAGAGGGDERAAPSTAGRAEGQRTAEEAPPAPPRPIIRFRVGQGRTSAAIVRRAGSTGRRPVVIFLHGWGLQQASAYRGWIRHLAATGNTVIVPRYQLDASADPGTVRAAALAGIRRALRRAPAAPGSLVVAGHSAGGALAADYAAVAADEGLPRPAAVFAVYPGRRILGYPGGIPEAGPGRLAPGTRLLVLAGANDTVVGDGPARDLVRRATQIPLERRRVLRVTHPAVADHYGPLRATAPARAAFWRRLDRLMARARGA